MISDSVSTGAPAPFHPVNAVSESPIVDMTVPELSANFKRANTERLSLLAGLVICRIKRCTPPGISVKSNGSVIYEAIKDVVVPGMLTVVIFSAADTGSAPNCLNPVNSVTDALKK